MNTAASMTDWCGKEARTLRESEPPPVLAMDATVQERLSIFRRVKGGSLNYPVNNAGGRIRQMNMDYSLCQAMKNSNMEGLETVIIIYDVMCQYYKNLHKRIEEAEFLEIFQNLAVYFGVGMFHITGHVLECFAQFAPSFIRGAGQVDGEILESLWAVLNQVSPSTQNATLASRTEMLDDQMNDSNWKKMLITGVCMHEFRSASGYTHELPVPQICRRYKAALVGQQESALLLDGFTENTEETEINLWQAQAEKAASDRIVNPAAMNIYESKFEKRVFCG